MKTIYKNCDIIIELQSIKDGIVYYNYSIIYPCLGKNEDRIVEGEMEYIGEKESLAHILAKVQEWIDDHV